MLTRADAIEAIAGQHFEVVVIGGGITGAGVALDAASRGYSVALLERGDYAVGTSSRSSKMVHGGLRYLQNFDLGLVREALLERQLMVQLAPHLVYPTPFLVAALGEERRDRKLGLGLNMYDVMATTRVGRSRRELRASKEEDEDFYWSPDRHRTIDREEVLELVPALTARDPKDAYLFYDCQTDDVRLVLTVLGEAERFGAVMLNGAKVTEVLSANGRATGVAAVEAESGERFEVGADHVVNATGVFADQIRPEETVDEEDVPRIAPSRGTHLVLDAADLPMGQAACIVPAGEGRMIFSLPWYGRTLIGTTDNDFEGDTAHPRPAEDDTEYLLDAANEFFGTSLVAVRPGRRLRRRAAADLDRRPAQVGRHLAQSGAVRDLLGDADDHRRQAHHLAADGEADRRPPGRARGPHRALSHGRDPARDGGPGRGPEGAGGGQRGLARPARLPLRPRLARRPRPRLEGPEAGARRSSPAVPTCWPRWRSPPAASRPAASPTCCCAAPGWGSWRRRSCAGPTRCGRSPRCSAPSWLVAAAGQAGGRGLAGGRRAGGHRPRRCRLNNLPLR